MARRVRPAAAEPVVVSGTALRIDVTVTSLTGSLPTLPLRAYLTPDGGRTEKRVELGQVRPGRATYTGEVTGCEAGCRLASIEVRQPGQVDFTAQLVVHGITQAAPTANSSRANSSAAGWRAGSRGRATGSRSRGPPTA